LQVAADPAIMKRQMDLLEAAVRPERPSSKRRDDGSHEGGAEEGCEGLSCC
jgi:hypothetical protein